MPGRWKHLEPVFGSMPAFELATDDVRHYVRKRQNESAADATINRELATLKRMFNLGLESTPPKVTRVSKFPMLKENNVRHGFVEDTDFTRLAAEAGELWLRLFLELGFTYGWRYGELVGLRVRQVNFAIETIRLDTGTTKNLDGREVTMTSKIAALLREATRGKKPEDFVLTRKGGRPIRDTRDAWQALCVRAGLGKFICSAFGGAIVEKCTKCGTDKKCERCNMRKQCAKCSGANRNTSVSSRTICGEGCTPCRSARERRDGDGRLAHFGDVS